MWIPSENRKKLSSKLSYILIRNAKSLERIFWKSYDILSVQKIVHSARHISKLIMNKSMGLESWWRCAKKFENYSNMDSVMSFDSSKHIRGSHFARWVKTLKKIRFLGGFLLFKLIEFDMGNLGLIKWWKKYWNIFHKLTSKHVKDNFFLMFKLFGTILANNIF